MRSTLFSSGIGYARGKFYSELLFVAIFSLSLLAVNAQQVSRNETQPNELTIYVIPSATPLNWTSPATLYKSFFRGYVSKFLKKEKYLLGHLFVKLSTPLLDSPLYAGMASASKKEKRILYLKEKVGMAILGVAMSGKLDTREELERKISHYSGKNKLAFITYRISEESARRILDFYRIFSSGSERNFSPSGFYGGAFWPRYENEGAGCTAFGLSMLDVAGLLGKETDNWKVSVDIPMELIGGEFNNNMKIRSRMIKKHKQWSDGSGQEEVDYVPFWIYDPSFIFTWIKAQRNLPVEARQNGYYPADQDKLPGLFTDRSKEKPDPDDPVIKPRTGNFFFLRPYYHKLGFDVIPKSADQ